MEWEWIIWTVENKWQTNENLITDQKDNSSNSNVSTFYCRRIFTIIACSTAIHKTSTVLHKLTFMCKTRMDSCKKRTFLQFGIKSRITQWVFPELMLWSRYFSVVRLQSVISIFASVHQHYKSSARFIQDLQYFCFQNWSLLIYYSMLDISPLIF